MNALKARRRYDAEREYEAWEEKQRKEQEYIDSLPEAERLEYLEKKKQKREDVMKLLALTSSITGPYNF